MTVTAPAPGAALSGSFAISATATDDTGVTGVVFKVDGVIIGDASAAPFTLTWDSTGTANGAHVLSATAFDAAANEATTTINVTLTKTRRRRM